MRQYAIRRMAYLPLIIIVVSCVTFFTLRLPFSQDPVTLLSTQSTTVEQQDAIREDLGLDKSVGQQFITWIGDMLRGDLGRTYRGNEPVWKEVRNRVPVTLEILGLALTLSTIIGVFVGVISALRQNTMTDYTARFFAVFGQSIPEFFLLILLIVLPSVWWNYSPPVGGHIPFFDDPWENLRLYGPPALLLGFGHSAAMMRLTRSTMLEVLRQDYIRTARAKGLKHSSVVIRHALRNSMIPIITLFGAQFGLLFFGSLIFEQIFSINGIGQFFFVSVLTSDFPVIQFLVLYTAIVVVCLNLLVDLSYALVDPRVKYR